MSIDNLNIFKHKRREATLMKTLTHPPKLLFMKRMKGPFFCVELYWGLQWPNGWMEGPFKGLVRVVLSHSRLILVLHWNARSHKTFSPSGVLALLYLHSPGQQVSHGPTLWFNCTVKDDWLSPSASTDLNTCCLILLLIFSTVIPFVRL